MGVRRRRGGCESGPGQPVTQGWGRAEVGNPHLIRSEVAGVRDMELNLTNGGKEMQGKTTPRDAARRNDTGRKMTPSEMTDACFF